MIPTMKVIGGIIAAGAIFFGFEGLDRAKVWVSPNGRMSYQNLMDNHSSGLDLWPTAGKRPTTDSVAEVTIRGSGSVGWDDPSAMERFSMSSMVFGQYRFGVEKGGAGKYHDIVFCFEAYTPTTARCPLKLTPDGVYISRDGEDWVKL